MGSMNNNLAMYRDAIFPGKKKGISILGTHHAAMPRNTIIKAKKKAKSTNKSVHNVLGSNNNG